ncbi:SIR2 family protein [Pseudomonas putida]
MQWISRELAPNKSLLVQSPWIDALFLVRLKMKNTVFFGNGINRLSTNAVSWDDLLDEIKGENSFSNGSLPNTMVYERIFMAEHKASESEKVDELIIKNKIASALAGQESNDVFKLLGGMDFEHYLTTNYDYALEKALGVDSEKLSSEEIYSLRRRRKYETGGGTKYLWNIHGEIDSPKSIMLGLDHYCGSVSKIDAYVKGNYKYSVDGEIISIKPMKFKLEKDSFCYTSWVDLFFSTNVHIVGFSLDYSETDLWWVLNKRARFVTENLVKNNIFFYVNDIDEQKKDLLESFDVKVVVTKVIDKDYDGMYRSAISKMLLPQISIRAA